MTTMHDNLISLDYEHDLWASGIERIAGVDEVGRGPLAGPVVAAAVILKRDSNVDGVNDSKKLTPSKRELLYNEISMNCISLGIGAVWHNEIDKMNILKATHLAMRKSIGKLHPQPQHLLVDGRGLPDRLYPQTAIISGDSLSASIAAASIIAKVTRDRMMIELAKVFPQYGFERNKGYGTPEHIRALKTYGPTNIHRRTFNRVENNDAVSISRSAKELGAYGERIAAVELVKDGYRIIESNYRAGKYGEIDLIVSKDDSTIVFVEVKTKAGKGFVNAEFRVDEKKRMQIGKTAEIYLSENKSQANEFRFDVIAVTFNGKQPMIKHFENAFWMNGGI